MVRGAKIASSKAADAVDEQLARYRAMRDFATTAEPSGDSPHQEVAAGLTFVIQKHAATRLHYDFRLGWNGVLKSWAVAKGPSYVTRDRRLAVQVEDHPMEYGGFEGTIPKGQYGGGTVLVWDQGTWEPHGDVDEGLRKGSLKFSLHGKKLSGKWTLVRMNGKAANEAKPNWLLIKEHDEFEQTAEAEPITEAAPDSVVTGRSLEQIAAAEDHVWNSKPATKKPLVNHARLAHRPAISGGELADAPEESFPGFQKPQLAAAADRAPEGREWLHELKLDGYRVQAHLQRLPSGPIATLYTRTGLDWTHRMPSVAEAVAQLPAQAAILDGEVVVLNEQGGTSFCALQSAFDEGANVPLHYFAFDLMHLDGHNLRGLALSQRKALLARLLGDGADGTLRFNEHMEGASGPEIFSQACSLGAEGIVSKQSSSRYVGGRNDAWLKLKCVRRQEFVIGGFTLPGDGGAGLGSLLLGYYEDDKLMHCGRTGTGFSQATQRMLRSKLEALRELKSPYGNKLTAVARKDAMWVRPELVCEVEFATWTADGLIRHAAFQGLREDKHPSEVVREDTSSAMKKRLRGQPAGQPPKQSGTAPSISAKANTETGSPRIEHAADKGLSTSVRLTHPDKVLDQESGVTKQQLALYYEAVAEVMLPHIEGRPVSIVRCPEGAMKQCFFQKHAAAGLPKALGKVEVPDKKTGIAEPYITVDSTEALASLAQMAGLEVHPWGSRNASLEAPDRLIFDLDPDEALPWATLAASVRSIRDLLKELKLESFVKSTGGKGLHIVVPIQPKTEWPKVKQFCRGVALAIESTDPSLYLIKMTKAARKGRIFVDYLRNERGATAVAPYSPRARAGMRVAVPLDWDELDQGMPTCSVANFDTWRDRLQHNPWAKLPQLKQSIRPAVLSAVLETSRA
jgi:bifunctional non-homologous end joining protein LigD